MKPDINARLRAAGTSNDKIEAALCIIKGADVNAADKDGMTPLHLASLYGNQELVEFFLKKGADPSIKNNKDETPLDLARKNNNRDISDIIRRFKDPVVKPITADIHELLKKNDMKGIMTVLETDTSLVNIKKEGFTPLHLACFIGNRFVSALLIKKGADVQSLNDDGLMPLHIATMKGHRAVVELLLENGCTVNDRDTNGFTPLHWAASRGHEQMAEMLIKNGANINSIGNHKKTPLFYAEEYGHRKLAQMLKDAGAIEF